MRQKKVFSIYIYFLLQELSGNTDEDQVPSVMFYTLQQTFTLLFYGNFAINFLLYCVTGQNFRRGVVGLCKATRQSSAQHDLQLNDRGASSTSYRRRANAPPASPSSRRFRGISHGGRRTATGKIRLTISPNARCYSLPNYNPPNHRSNRILRIG